MDKLSAPGADSGTVYTCPMHPEILQDKPGNCPICGMTLEPLTRESKKDDSLGAAIFLHAIHSTGAAVKLFRQGVAKLGAVEGLRRRLLTSVGIRPLAYFRPFSLGDPNEPST